MAGILDAVTTIADAFHAARTFLQGLFDVLRFSRLTEILKEKNRTKRALFLAIFFTLWVILLSVISFLVWTLMA